MEGKVENRTILGNVWYTAKHVAFKDVVQVPEQLQLFHNCSFSYLCQVC